MLETGVEPVRTSDAKRVLRSSARPVIIVVSGWRHYPAERNDWVIRTVRQQVVGAAVANRGVHIRYGDCKTGLDALIKRWARTLTPSFATHCEYEADWSLPSRSGGPVRNNRMLTGADENGQYADRLIAFPEPGKRRLHSGTWGCIDLAHENGIEVVIPSWKEPDSD